MHVVMPHSIDANVLGWYVCTHAALPAFCMPQHVYGYEIRWHNQFAQVHARAMELTHASRHVATKILYLKQGDPSKGYIHTSHCMSSLDVWLGIKHHCELMQCEYRASAMTGRTQVP